MDHFVAAVDLIKRLQGEGHIAYFAGGYVRDYLMGHPSADIDIASSALSSEVIALFPKTIPVGINFGIVIVVHEGHQFEVASFRKDLGYADGRRPLAIARATPEEDAMRRDFTINGMFYDPLTQVLYDFVGGEEDIKAKMVRAIGDPHARFLEDRLRMIRAVRYAARFGFTIHPDTLKAIDAHAGTLFPAVAIERIMHEFEKMGHFANFNEALVMLHRHHLLQAIFPSLPPCTEERLLSLPRHGPVILRLLALFDLDLPGKEAFCTALKLSNKERSLVLYAHTLSQTPFGADDHTWAHLYAHPLYPIVSQFLHFGDAHFDRRQVLLPYITRLKEKRPLVTAADLLAAGHQPGPALGALLDKAERLSINEKIEDKALLLKLCLE